MLGCNDSFHKTLSIADLVVLADHAIVPSEGYRITTVGTYEYQLVDPNNPDHILRFNTSAALVW
jgi:hypothetical protein